MNLEADDNLDLSIEFPTFDERFDHREEGILIQLGGERAYIVEVELERVGRRGLSELQEAEIGLESHCVEDEREEEVVVVVLVVGLKGA